MNFGWLLYFGFVALILFLGWNEPLKYRFTPPVKAATPAPQIAVQTPNAGPPKWMYDTQRWDSRQREFDKQRGASAPGAPQYQR